MGSSRGSKSIMVLDRTSARTLRFMALLSIIGLGALIPTGCEDHRIPLAAYLAQKELAELATEVPTTQPVGPGLEPWSPGPYRLGTGDVVGITVTGLENLGQPASHQLRVTEKGDIYLPMVGRLHVEGLTLDEVEAEVKKGYVPTYITDTEVMAQILNYETISVIVMGDVFRLTSGSQMVELRRNKASILQALLAAGGAQDYSGSVTVIPARDPEAAVTYDMASVSDLVRAARPGSVEDADILVVNNRPNDAIFVEGLVNRPGPIPFPRSARMTVLQAIGAAGGTLLAFEPREATLMRHNPDGKLVSVKIDLDRIKTGIDPDMALAAGDMLILPHNAATRIEEYIAKSFMFRIGTGVETAYNPWTLYYLRKSNEFNRVGNNTLRNALQTGIIQPFVNPPVAPNP